MKPRVFILGLDGADDNSVGAAVRRGLMPNLARAVRGNLLPLRSTPLPITPAAWTAAYTGRNPGKTGVLTFQRRIPNSYRGRLVNANDVGNAGFHTRVAEAGRTVVAVGFPMMSPPPEKSGSTIVSGWDSAPHQPLANESAVLGTLQKFDYRIDDDFSSDATLLRKSIDTRFSILRELLDTRDWDCSMLYLGFIDGLGHRLGAANPQTMELLEHTDEKLGEFLAYIGEAHFILCSDHGFGSFSASFSVMQWLEKHGYLALRSRNFKSSNEGGIPGLEVMDLDDGVVDWGNTRAFCWDAVGSHAAISLNLKGAYPRGTVSEREAYALASQIIERLLAERDAETGLPLIVAAQRREELFWGPHTAEFPEVFLETASHITAYIAKRKRVDGGFSLEEGVVHTGSLSSHRMDGIWGSSFPVSGDLHIEDVATTVYALLELPIPSDCDGENRSPNLAMSAVAAPAAPASDETPYSAEEEEIVRKRLEDLGYL